MGRLSRERALDLYVANFDPTVPEFCELAGSLGPWPGDASLDMFFRDSWGCDMASELARGLDFTSYAKTLRAPDGSDGIADGTPEHAWLHDLWEQTCMRHPYYADSMRFWHEGAYDDAFAQGRLADELMRVAHANVHATRRGLEDDVCDDDGPYADVMSYARGLLVSEMLDWMASENHPVPIFDDYARHLDIPAPIKDRDVVVGELRSCWEAALAIRDAHAGA